MVGVVVAGLIVIMDAMMAVALVVEAVVVVVVEVEAVMAFHNEMVIGHAADAQTKISLGEMNAIGKAIEYLRLFFSLTSAISLIAAKPRRVMAAAEVVAVEWMAIEVVVTVVVVVLMKAVVVDAVVDSEEVVAAAAAGTLEEAAVVVDLEAAVEETALPVEGNLIKQQVKYFFYIFYIIFSVIEEEIAVAPTK